MQDNINLNNCHAKLRSCACVCVCVCMWEGGNSFNGSRILIQSKMINLMENVFITIIVMNYSVPLTAHLQIKIKSGF